LPRLGAGSASKDALTPRESAFDERLRIVLDRGKPIEEGFVVQG